MMHVIRAEWSKTLALRSIRATVVAALLVPPVLAAASGLALGHNAVPDFAAALPVESHGFETAGLGQPLVILLAALITGGEYVDGQLRSTLLATPRRIRVLVAKFVVVAGLAGGIGIVATAAAVTLKHAALGDRGLAPSQFTATMGWNLVGVTINYTVIAMIAAALTIIVRTYIVTLIFMIPLVLGLTLSLLGVIPVLRYAPDLAGLQLLTRYPGVGLLDPIPGALVMTGWMVVAVATSVVLFTRRDTGGG